MQFWIASAAMTAIVALFVLAALLRGRTAADPAAAYDLKVYRDQLREVERDVARGVIAPEDAERLRTEVSRRVLEADRAVQGSQSSRAAPKAATLAAGTAVVLVLAGAFATYWRIGAPEYPDMPLAARVEAADSLRGARPLQALAEAQTPVAQPPLDPDYAALVDQLRTAVAARPDDLRGHELLAQNEAGLGNFAAAYAAQARVIEIRGAAATAADFAQKADLMILAAGGYISPEAETALTMALERDPKNGIARYYSGLMFAQTGRPDLAFQLWRPLLEDSVAGDPWTMPLRAQIEDVAMRAGAPFSLPPEVPALQETLPGPDAAGVAAAADMTPEAQAEMIRTMVAGLSDRLASGGGSAAEWARLVAAYGVLQDKPAATDAWSRAQTALSADPDGLEQVRAAAVQAGVAG